MLDYKHYRKAHLGYGICGERSEFQQRTLALLRLVVVSVILLGYFLINQDLGREVLMVLISAELVSGLIFFLKPLHIWLSRHRYIDFFIDEFLIFLACFYSGGLHSPYIFALFLPLLVHAISPVSMRLAVVTAVTIGNLFLIGSATTTLEWQLFIHIAICLLLGGAVINILVYNDVLVLSTYAIHDGLTGLYSYQYFWDQLRSMLQPGHQTKTFSLIMIDLDEFKKLNDEYGHLEGDRVLKEIADTIKMNVRDSDLVARYGGDEFAIILPGISYQMCRSVVDRLSSAIVDLGYFEHVSIGAALYPDEAETAEALVNLADTRMYREKRSNKNQLLHLPNITS
jgi:diguanylate cyclase (GGDEF)-like protein